MKKILIIAIAICAIQLVNAQNYKLGKVSKEELEEAVYPADSSANAAVLFKKRVTRFKYIKGKGFLVETEIHERIKIYNADGYDWASKEIEYYSHSSSENERVQIKDAKTYKLVGGKIETTKLSKKEVFDERRNQYWSRKKFTMPNISDGCVVEISYVLTSPYTSIDDVMVQQEIPIKKFEISIQMPEYYRYNMKQKGYIPFKIENDSRMDKIVQSVKSSDRTDNENTQFSTSTVEYKTNIIRVNESNIPALRKEPYVNNMNNYRSALSFELASVKWPNEPFKNYSTSWETIAENIYQSDRFGGQLKKTAHLKDDIALLEKENVSMLEKVSSSLAYVKSKIKWNGNYGEYPEKGIRTAYKEGTGNVGDINLTLVVVLRELGINANPVLISTRSNGVPLFPTAKGINYVAVAVSTNNGNILLDASEKYSLPNVLPLRAMNWNGIVVEKGGKSSFVKLVGKRASQEVANLSYSIDDDGFIKGINRVKYGNLMAINYRNTNANLDQDDLISRVEEGKDDIEIVNLRLSNKDDISKSLMEMYSFEKEDGAEAIGDKLYLSPMLFSAMDENPFKLDEREYPVDFGAPFLDKTTVTIKIPEGYKVEFIPATVGIGISDNLGKFIYKVSSSGSKINVTSTLEIAEGVIPALYYEELKEFFKQVVSKQTEKVVLSRI